MTLLWSQDFIFLAQIFITLRFKTGLEQVHLRRFGRSCAGRDCIRVARVNGLRRKLPAAKQNKPCIFF